MDDYQLPEDSTIMEESKSRAGPADDERLRIPNMVAIPETNEPLDSARAADTIQLQVPQPEVPIPPETPPNDSPDLQRVVK